MTVTVSRSQLTRIVVAIDPAVTSGEESDDSGIIVVARGPHVTGGTPECSIPYCPGHGFVLEDRTCHASPTEVARTAVEAFDDWKADRIVAEVNNGADYIGTVVHTVRAGVPFKAVRATRGKLLRAEPASALYEQGRCHHIGSFPELEQQQETWTPDSRWSPDRLDALVWGLTELGLVGAQGAAFSEVWRDEVADRRQGPAPLGIPPLHVEDELTVCACREPRWSDWGGVVKCVHCGGGKNDG